MKTQDRQIEKRKFKRVKLNKDVSIDIDIDNDTASFYMLDISKGGLKIKSNSMLTPGTVVNVKISPEKILEAEIKWVKKVSDKGEYYVGLEFTQAQDSDSDAIADFLKFENRREFERKTPGRSISIDIWDAEDESKLREVVSVIDISAGGAKIKVGRPLTAGNILNLKLSDNTIVLGEVRWCSKAKKSKNIYFAGLEFIKEENGKGVNEDADRNIVDRGERIAKAPAKVNYHNRFAIALRKKKRFEDALVNYEKALKIDPRNEVICFNMARLYVDMNNLEKAADSLLEALKIDPGFIEAESMLKEIKGE